MAGRPLIAYTLDALAAAGIEDVVVVTGYREQQLRAALLEGKPTSQLGPSLVPTLLLGALAIPIGIAIFGWGERFAKRTGRLKRSG